MLLLIVATGAVMCSIVASQKNLNVVGWFIAGALLPLIAFIVVMCAKRAPSAEESWDEAARRRLDPSQP